MQTATCGLLGQETESDTSDCDMAWLIRRNAVASHRGDVATAGKERLIYMKGNPGVTRSFPLTMLPKTLQLTVIIAF